MAHEKLEECVRSNLQLYLDDLQGQEPSNMYDMLLRVVEKPMLELVMEQTRNNQSRAAQWLGLNRNTLRKKLVDHGMLTTSVRS
ncbi:helix-turn-helix domain-containing protein [Brachymonas denitrificans]|jgi:Fis family transcriptional regulator|uniref:Putative Fis-like DNA-binding protein n=1 Tax=Brachymonas denitrificans DSM 15123 TaxID=1121117 RepID=A0A1H8D826_9BURK|nr:helix-turn-helix domain-containing protein [Brachymonas denitrificans]SEN03399.1 Fis family transcriptional regulator, factor for inversion stimulation protein [Brachymonas denitrificans DSM 15123]